MSPRSSSSATTPRTFSCATPPEGDSEFAGLSLFTENSYNTSVNSAKWDDETKWWTIGSQEGRTFKTRRVVWCTGYFTKRFVPDIPGLENFKGEVHHPGAWPVGGVDVAGKRVGIIGTGASAVQLIQDIAGEVKDLTIFQVSIEGFNLAFHR